MAHFDLSGRPEFDVCNLPFTQEIRDRIDFFESRSLIVWIGRNRPNTDTAHVVEAFMSRFDLNQSSIQVSRHNPVDFLVSILDRDVFEEVAGRDSFTHGGRQFRLRRWSPKDQANRAAMRYHVRLCLEGLPLHLWSETFAAAVIGRSCSLHFAEERSRRREATDLFELMAWTADPVAIPLHVWLTVTDSDPSGQSSTRVVVYRQRPSEPRRGMVYDVIIHIISVEDTRRCGPDGRPHFYPFCFTLGAADADQDVAPAPAPFRQLMMRQGGRTILSVRWFPLGILALRNLGRSSGTALMKTMKATVKAGAVGPLRHNDEAFSSASTGRRTRAAQGSARQGVATAKAPDMEAGVTVVTGP
jgi:hypothetical protein